MSTPGAAASLLQISDTHFGTEQRPVVDALLRLAARCRPDLVVLSGDVTQRARRAEFARAQAFVQRLGRPALVLPGNHDIPLYNLALRLFAPYANYRRAFGAELEPEFENEALLVLGVNTTRAARHKDGVVSAAQIERVSRRLRRARPAQLRVVVTHQPVHVITQKDVKNLLHGHRQAVPAWAAAGADLILGGHIHLPYVRPLRECFPQLAREAWAVQAGTAVSSRVRFGAPNSVNLVRHQAEHADCSVERWEFERLSGEFVCAARHDLRLQRP